MNEVCWSAAEKLHIYIEQTKHSVCMRHIGIKTLDSSELMQKHELARGRETIAFR